MGENDLISVLMPVYKAEQRFLKIAVESILDQTYPNFELIIMYEGDKKDGAYQYLREVTDRRMKIIILPPKSGLPRSLNAGLIEARGKYIARMDADDYSEKRRFEKQLKYMEQHTDVAVLGCVCQVMDSKRLMFSNRIPPEIRRVRMLFGNAGIAHPTAFIRKSFLDENGIRYNEEIRGSEDYHLWVDITIAGGKIDTLGEVLLRYRLHGGQASKLYEKEMVEWDGMARRKLLQCMGKFTEEEICGFLEFTLCRGEKIEPKKSSDVLLEFRKLPAVMQMSDCETLRREITYQWVRKGVSSLLRVREGKMLRWVYLRKIWERGDIWYLVREFGRELVTRIMFCHG